MLAQHLGERQHEVGRGRPGRQCAGEADADDDRGGEIRGLAEHRRLGLDPADAPSEHAKPVDHRGVRIGAHERVGDRNFSTTDVADLDHLRHVLEVHLVADTHTGRHEREVVKRLLRPAQERVALMVPLDLALDVPRVRVAETEGIDLDRVVDDQVDRHQRIDFAGVLARTLHGRTHGGEVDHGRHTGEVLHEDASRQERELSPFRRGRRPRGEGPDIFLCGGAGFGEAHQALEQDLDRHGEARCVGQAGLWKIG